VLLCAGAHGSLPSKQLVLVLTDDPNAFEGILYQYESRSGQWHLQGKSKQVVVGKKGLIAHASKQEGDKRTPMGLFPLGPIFGFEKTFGQNSKMDYRPIQASTVCVDDSKSHAYNQIVENNDASKDWDSHEPMRDIIEYQFGAVIQYNLPEPKKQAGSCIFLHILPIPYQGTSGCVAMSEPDLLELLAWLDKAQQPVLGVYTRAEYARIQHEQQLPAIS
jgi:L,D-peptidoglycan transpeptidase YkuD (ErfK/YbiS/YcfS/YnhG family)